jgi:hypothetical protein
VKRSWSGLLSLNPRLPPHSKPPPKLARKVHQVENPSGRVMELRGMELSGVPAISMLLRGIELSGMELRGIELSGTAVRSMELRGMELRGMELSGLSLSVLPVPRIAWKSSANVLLPVSPRSAQVKPGKSMR